MTYNNKHFLISQMCKFQWLWADTCVPTSTVIYRVVDWLCSLSLALIICLRVDLFYQPISKGFAWYDQGALALLFPSFFIWFSIACCHENRFSGSTQTETQECLLLPLHSWSSWRKAAIFRVRSGNLKLCCPRAAWLFSSHTNLLSLFYTWQAICTGG